MTISAQAMASYEKEAAYRDTFYGGNAAVAALRCFRRYDRNATVDIEDQYGRLRWMGQKQARVYGIVHRLSVSGNRMTMTAIAKEAQCVPSTVSRSILKFQTWGMFVIDITRGRNGGISVRLRTIGDGLQRYAKAAWDRITAAANRARINVASLINLKEEGYREPEPDTEVRTSLTRSSYMDATFSEAWANAEARGAEIRAEAARAERETAFLGPRDQRPVWEDPRWVADLAARVISERRQMDAEDPDWWLIAEEARERLIKDA